MKMSKTDWLFGILIAAIIALVWLLSIEEKNNDSLMIDLELKTQSLNIETAKVELFERRVEELEGMIEQDDILLYHFTHETWDRKCTYDIQAGITLADGSVKSSVVQFCD
jgi:hypothetical protein